MESVATSEEVRDFLTVPGDGSGYGYGDGSGYGYGDGYGDGYGYGYGDGYGYGYGDGDGSGYGYGDGSGYGSGYGYGYGCGYGCGYGYGYGDGDSDGIKKYVDDDVHYIDGIPCIVVLVRGDYASVLVIGDDLTLKCAYVAKVGRHFGHGSKLRDAYDAAMEKELVDSPVEDRIARFVEAHPDPDSPYDDLFSWHHILTGSCEFGRIEWCKAHGYQPTDSITVRTFIAQTQNDYGGDVISQLAKEYSL